MSRPKIKGKTWGFLLGFSHKANRSAFRGGGVDGQLDDRDLLVAAYSVISPENAVDSGGRSAGL